MHVSWRNKKCDATERQKKIFKVMIQPKCIFAYVWKMALHQSWFEIEIFYTARTLNIWHSKWNTKCVHSVCRFFVYYCVMCLEKIKCEKNHEKHDNHEISEYFIEAATNISNRKCVSVGNATFSFGNFAFSLLLRNEFFFSLFTVSVSIFASIRLICHFTWPHKHHNGKCVLADWIVNVAAVCAKFYSPMIGKLLGFFMLLEKVCDIEFSQILWIICVFISKKENRTKFLSGNICCNVHTVYIIKQVPPFWIRWNVTSYRFGHASSEKENKKSNWVTIPGSKATTKFFFR